MNLPLVLRQARKAVAKQDYGEAAVLYTSMMSHEDMADNFDIKVRHAFCVEKTGHINQAIKLYEGIVKLYREAGEERAAEDVERIIDGLVDKVNEKEARKKAEARDAAAAKAKAEREAAKKAEAERIAVETAAAEKARIAKEEIDKLRLEKALVAEAEAEKARIAEVERERLRIEEEENARLQELLIKKEKAEKVRAKRHNVKTFTEQEQTSTVEIEVFDPEELAQNGQIPMLEMLDAGKAETKQDGTEEFTEKKQASVVELELVSLEEAGVSDSDEGLFHGIDTVQIEAH